MAMAHHSNIPDENLQNPDQLKAQLIARHDGNVNSAAGELIRFIQKTRIGDDLKLLTAGKIEDPDEALEALMDLAPRTYIRRLLAGDERY